MDTCSQVSAMRSWRRPGASVVSWSSSTRRAGRTSGAEEWQERVLSDGSRHRVYKRFFAAQELADELGGHVLYAGRWFVVVAS